MLRFFRHIRKSLMEQPTNGLTGNKIRAYITYAIGEVFLVMVGILIALQVNNWNEERKEQEFLNFALHELYQDMYRDMVLIYEGIEPRLQRREKSIEELFEMSVADTIVSDEQFLDSYFYIDGSFSFSPIFGSYETLKQRGLDKIRDKKLRKSIIDFYEYDLPRAVNFIHKSDADLVNHTLQMEQSFLERKIHQYEDNLPHIDSKLSVPEVFNNQAILELMELHYSDAEHKRYRINGIITKYYRLMEFLEEELEERSVSFVKFDSEKVTPDF